MKVKYALILVVAALFIFLVTRTSSWLAINSAVKAPQNFKSYIYQSKPFSMSLYQSDYVRNAFVLNHVVGTLVKFDNIGNVKPFLAKEVITSQNKKVWKFKLHRGLFCEDGEKINAASYAHNLVRLLKIYKSRGPILEFEKLVGIEGLINSDAIDGISSQDNTLILNFKTPPEKLLERLNDTYFGYICKGNFEDDEKTWRDDKRIISSGLYKLKENINNRKILIEKRLGLPIGEEVTFANAEFQLIQDFNNIDKVSSYLQLTNTIPNLEEFHIIKGVPTFTVNVTTPVQKGNLFASKKIRKKFFRLLYRYKNNEKYSDISTAPTNTIFPFKNHKYLDFISEEKNEAYEEEILFKKNAQVLVDISSSLSDDYVKYLMRLFNRIGRDMNFEAEIYNPDMKIKINEENKRSYDIRVTVVDLDAIPYFSLLDMIFCSQLGARYPDPSGKLCDFIKAKLNSHEGPLTQDQLEKLYKLLTLDPALMPISHRSLTHLYSRDIDLSSVSGTVLYPRIDLIKAKEID